jgi:5'(3')-deoxyribonucleotidase
MRIGIDVDGVLANFTKGYAKVIRELSGRDLLTDEMIARPPSWYWDRDAGYTKAEENAAWDFINDSPNFWSDLSPFPDAIKAISKLGFEHDVYFITTRTGQQPKHQTEEFLVDQIPYLPTVLISPNKGPVALGLGLDLFIDDRDKNIIEVAQASPKTMCCVLDYPYNQDLPDLPNIHRVYSVLQALQETGAVEYNYN